MVNGKIDNNKSVSLFNFFTDLETHEINNIFEKTKYGWIWAHAYQFDANTATFIVECSQSTFDKFGFSNLSQQESIDICQNIFSKYLDGNSLMTNASHIRGSAWIKFPRVLCEKWSHENIVLLGDAAATAHFSIGSGTKLALESGISLANNLQYLVLQYYLYYL